MTIVIAWTVIVLAWDGRPYRRDLGESPGLAEVRSPRAVVWLLNGEQCDVDDAMAAAEKIDPSARVYTFNPSVRDPLGEAKRMVMEPA